MTRPSLTTLADAFPIRYSHRAKRMSIVVHFDGRWEIVIPARRAPSFRQVHTFVNDHWDWIQSQVAKTKRGPVKQPLTHRGVPRERVKERTRQLIWEYIEAFCQVHPFVVSRVKLGNYSSQWGSCSDGHALSFHYKLCLLPDRLFAYVVAHELCHTFHFDHSKAFWELLETISPGAKKHRKELREYVL
jgi:predicted metal-dependent hydrolase